MTWAWLRGFLFLRIFELPGVRTTILNFLKCYQNFIIFLNDREFRIHGIRAQVRVFFGFSGSGVRKYVKLNRSGTVADTATALWSWTTRFRGSSRVFPAELFVWHVCRASTAECAGASRVSEKTQNRTQNASSSSGPQGDRCTREPLGRPHVGGGERARRCRSGFEHRHGNNNCQF